MEQVSDTLHLQLRVGGKQLLVHFTIENENRNNEDKRKEENDK
jgi:hypothetical protein